MVKNRQLFVADFLMVLKFLSAFWGRRRRPRLLRKSVNSPLEKVAAVGWLAKRL